MFDVTQLYEAADRAGLLTPVKVGTVTVACAFRAPDEAVLDGLALSRDYQIEFPTARLQLQSGDLVEINGAFYLVRDVQRMRDGSETQARLSKVD